MTKNNAMSAGIAAVLGLATGVFLLGSSNEASAKGCNGVVNQLEWGCAAWDNNNGPDYPHYKKPANAQPAAAQPAPKVAAPAAPVIKPNGSNGVISRDAAGIVSHDGGGLVGNAGGTMRR
jgi:hypothetical protein